MTPRVSAIVIVRDGERFLAEAIDSILAQQGPATELLVVDDGSRDRSADIVRSYGRDARLLSHAGGANLGMSASRNLGLAEARGEYVAFLDADDVWLPGKLAEQAAILEAAPDTAMVYGRSLIWRSWDPQARRPDFFYPLGVTPDESYPPGRLFRLLLTNRYQTPTTCNAMMRRRGLLAVGGGDPALRGLFEDQLLFAKLLLRFPAHVSSRCWARYRQHDGAASSGVVDALTVDRLQLQYLAALGDYMRSSGGAPLRDRAALRWTVAAVAARIAARQAKRALVR